MIAKWILILKVCTLNGDISCAPDLENTVRFMDWYSCNLTGHADTLRMYENLGYTDIDELNNDKVTIIHHCELQEVGSGT